MRFLSSLLIVALTLAACKVDRTPPELHGARAAETTPPEDDLRAQINVLLSALDRGDVGDAMRTLAPFARVRVVTEPLDAPRTVGPEYVEEVMERLVRGGVSLRAGSLEVEVEERSARAGWFVAQLRVDPAREEDENGVRDLSGVFWLDEGEWRLVMLHLSERSTPPDPAEAELEGG